MSPEQVFDYFAIRLDGKAAHRLGDHLFAWRLTDTGQEVRLRLSNGTLHGTPDRPTAGASATVSSTRPALDELVATGDRLRDALAAGSVDIDGDREAILAVWDAMVDFPMFYPLIEPGSHARRS
ncbi:MAG: alkyl sulfatase C-terminal domain-containing protein [Actinomycetota bacterium]